MVETYQLMHKLSATMRHTQWSLRLSRYLSYLILRSYANYHAIDDGTRGVEDAFYKSSVLSSTHSPLTNITVTAIHPVDHSHEIPHPTPNPTFLSSAIINTVETMAAPTRLKPQPIIKYIVIRLNRGLISYLSITFDRYVTLRSPSIAPVSLIQAASVGFHAVRFRDEDIFKGSFHFL